MSQEHKPAHTWRTRLTHFYLRRPVRPWACVLVTIVFAAIGATLIWQPGRYANTPSYANLIKILSAQTWGIIYLTISGLMLVYLLAYAKHSYAIAVHTLMFTLSAVWLLAFIVRYFTDSGTTIVNVASWLTYTMLILMSGLSIDETSYAQSKDSIETVA